MKILVAGGAGYIGSCCTEYLLDRGHDVVVFDSLLKGHRDAVDERAEFIRGDLADGALIDDVIGDHNPEGIIHFAAFIEVGESMTRPSSYFRNNVSCGLNLLDAAVKHDIRKVVFSSTAAVYGMPQKIPIPETEPTKPISVYGESKLMFENILRWYEQIHGLQYTALRYFNAAGATSHFGENHDPESHLIPIMLQVATGKRDAIKIYGSDYNTPDGTCIRDYIHVIDLAQAHLLALQHEESGVFNLGSGSGYSVREIIEVTREITGHKIPAVETARRPGDPPRLISDSTAARKILGWTPTHDDIHAIIGSAWKWRREHPTGYHK